MTGGAGHGAPDNLPLTHISMNMLKGRVLGAVSPTPLPCGEQPPGRASGGGVSLLACRE